MEWTSQLCPIPLFFCCSPMYGGWRLIKHDPPMPWAIRTWQAWWTCLVSSCNRRQWEIVRESSWRSNEICAHKDQRWSKSVNFGWYSYGHLSVVTGYFSGIIHSINGVMLVLITGISGHNCRNHAKHGQVWRRPCILWRGIKKWPETRRRKPSWRYPCGTSLIEGHVFNTVFERNSCRYCMFMAFCMAFLWRNEHRLWCVFHIPCVSSVFYLVEEDFEFPCISTCIFMHFSVFPHRLKWHFHRLPLRFNKTQAPQQDPKPPLSATTSTKVGAIRRSWVKNAVIWWEIWWLIVVNTG